MLTIKEFILSYFREVNYSNYGKTNSYVTYYFYIQN